MFELLTEKFSTIFTKLTGKSTLNEHTLQDAIQNIQTALLDADVPHTIAQKFIQEVKIKVIGTKAIKSVSPTDQFIKIVHDELVHFLSAPTTATLHEYRSPSLILMVGLQGSGKTTTIAKLAHSLKEKRPNSRIATASLDFSRPAAQEQLKVLANHVGITYYHTQNNTPETAAHEIITKLVPTHDLIIVDTAGRMHVDQELLGEFQTIAKICQPTYTLLVLDAMTGQQSLPIAQTFANTIALTGVVLTKIDSETRAGAAFACTYELKKPILFVGTGEKIDELEPFIPTRVATRILGMGDLTSLHERIELRLKEQDMESLSQRMLSGHFTLNDFAQQMDMMSKLGSLGSIMRFLPGMGTIDRTTIEKGEYELRSFRAIINSMTQKERARPEILSHSHIQRISRGAGVPTTAVRALVAKFEQSKHFVKLLNKTRF